MSTLLHKMSLLTPEQRCVVYEIDGKEEVEELEFLSDDEFITKIQGKLDGKNRLAKL